MKKINILLIILTISMNMIIKESTAQEYPTERFKKWKTTQRIDVRIFKSLPLLRAFEEVKTEISDLLPVHFRQTLEKEDIYLGYYSDSPYFAEAPLPFWEMLKTYQMLAGRVGGTLFLDSQGHTLSVHEGYKDQNFERIETLILQPNILLRVLHPTWIASVEGKTLQEKTDRIITNIAKHEMYHALGLMHESSDGVKEEACKLMRESVICSGPSPEELKALVKIWKEHYGNF